MFFKLIKVHLLVRELNYVFCFTFVGNFDFRREKRMYILNMSDLTSVLPIISLFVIVYLQTTFHIQYIDISTSVNVTTRVTSQRTLYIIK